MTPQAHTPGPWQLYHLPFTDSDNGIDLKGNNGNTLIANFPTLERIEGVAYVPSDEDAANLCLIAAAPDLLEALRLLLDTYAPHRDESNPDKLHSAVRSALFTIARATGKE